MDFDDTQPENQSRSGSDVLNYADIKTWSLFCF